MRKKWRHCVALIKCTSNLPLALLPPPTLHRVGRPEKFLEKFQCKAKEAENAPRREKWHWSEAISYIVKLSTF